MILYVNSNNEIKDVESTHDDTLIPIELSDDPEVNPFVGWSTAKICCYRVTVEDGVVTMYTPYIPSSELSYVDTLGRQIDRLAATLDFIAMETDVDIESEV